MTITELKTTSTGKVIDMETGRVMTPEQARRDYLIVTDPEVFEIIKELVRKLKGGQAKLEDFG